MDRRPLQIMPNDGSSVAAALDEAVDEARLEVPERLGFARDPCHRHSLDLGLVGQTEVDPRIARRHVAALRSYASV